MPVKLEPGKTYVIWFNRGQFDSFCDTANHPAVPYFTRRVYLLVPTAAPSALERAASNARG
jgi:hypothetical protein